MVKIKLVEDFHTGIGPSLQDEFDEAAKDHVEVVSENGMLVWVFDSEEEAQPLEDLLTKWEKEHD